MKFEKTFKEQYSTFPTQGLNPGLLSLWEDSLPAEPQGKPEFQSKSHTFPRYQKAMKIFSFAIKKMIQSLHVNITAKYLEFNKMTMLFLGNLKQLFSCQS